jgi:hypothetical protein
MNSFLSVAGHLTLYVCVRVVLNHMMDSYLFEQAWIMARLSPLEDRPASIRGRAAQLRPQKRSSSGLGLVMGGMC